MQKTIDFLRNLYLEKNYITESEANAKCSLFENMFQEKSDDILIAAIEEWNKSFSGSKDFFDDLSRYSTIVERLFSGRDREFKEHQKHDVIRNTKGQTLWQYLADEQNKRIPNYEKGEYEVSRVSGFAGVFECMHKMVCDEEKRVKQKIQFESFRKNKTIKKPLNDDLPF